MKESLAEDERNALLQLCLAEYQALTTRCSYWIVLQIGLLPVVPVYLVLAVTVWQSGVIIREVVLWTTLAGLQLIALLWAQTMIEQFAIVKYIECYLRRILETVVDGDLFWGYEPYLVMHRPVKSIYGGLSVPFLIVVVLAVTLICRLKEFSRWDFCGVVVNLMLLVIVCWSTYTAGKLQREWSKSDKMLAQKLDEMAPRTNS